MTYKIKGHVNGNNAVHSCLPFANKNDGKSSKIALLYIHFVVFIPSLNLEQDHKYCMKISIRYIVTYELVLEKYTF